MDSEREGRRPRRPLSSFNKLLCFASTWRHRRPSQAHRTWLAGIGLAIFLITLALFAHAARYDFVNLDDAIYVRDNPHMTGGLNVGNVGWALTSMRDAACWMPLTWLSYLTDVSLGGVNPGALHLVNAGYHACNAVLLFLLLWAVPRRCACGPEDVAPGRGAAMLACAAGALFWALHPLRVESVAWIASRKDVLSLFWELLALLCWVRALERSDDGGRDQRSRPWVRASLLCCALALLAKPVAITFPILAASIEYLLTRRVCPRRLSGFCCLALIGGAMGVIAQHAGGATVKLAGVPLYGRLLNAVASIGIYARDTVWPTALAVPYPHAWPALPLFFWPALGICVAAGGWLVWAVWREGRDQWSVGNRVWRCLFQTAARRQSAATTAGDTCSHAAATAGDTCAHAATTAGDTCSHAAATAGDTCSHAAATDTPCSHAAQPACWTRTRGGRAPRLQPAIVAATPLCRRADRKPAAAERRDYSRLRSLVIVGLLWALMSVAPMLGLFNFGFHSHADRFTYLPAIGLSLILTGGLLAAARFSPSAGGVCGLALLLALALLARQTFSQTRYWQNDGTLFTHTLRVTGENEIAHGSLGLYFFRKHLDLDAAVTHFGRFIEMSGPKVPHHYRAMYAIMLAETGRMQAAERQARLLNEGPAEPGAGRNVSSLVAYGAIALYKGDLDLARQHLGRAASEAPKEADAHYLLGRLAMQEGKLAEAAREWRLALKADVRFEFLKGEIETCGRANAVGGGDLF